jgi:hypothetical protein
VQKLFFEKLGLQPSKNKIPKKIVSKIKKLIFRRYIVLTHIKTGFIFSFAPPPRGELGNSSPPFSSPLDGGKIHTLSSILVEDY